MSTEAEKPSVRNEDVIREMMDRLGVGYQRAKEIFKHAKSPPGTFKRIGNSRSKRDMSAEEAKRIVDETLAHIALIDEGG